MWSWFVTSVWPNLVASVLWVTPALFAHHRILKTKLRTKLDQLQDETNGRLDRLHDKIEHLIDREAAE